MKSALITSLLSIPIAFIALVFSMFLFDSPAATFAGLLPQLLFLFGVPAIILSVVAYRSDRSHGVLWALGIFLVFGFGLWCVH